MSRRKKLINNTAVPQYQIEAIARCILPDILAFYESEEGQREFAEWQAQQMKGEMQRGQMEKNSMKTAKTGRHRQMVTPRFLLMDAFESFSYLLHMSFCCCIDRLPIKFLL